MLTLTTSRVLQLNLKGVRHAHSHHRILIVGAGTAGVTVAAQLQRAFRGEGRALKEGEIGVVDEAKEHACEFA